MILLGFQPAKNGGFLDFAGPSTAMLIEMEVS